MKYQSGSLRKQRRKSGEEVWEFRYRDSSQVMRQKTFQVKDYPSLTSVKVAVQGLVFAMNDTSAMNKTTPFGMVVERFIVEERLREIASQPVGPVGLPGVAFSTAIGRLSCFRKHILPRWADIPIQDIKAWDVQQWLKDMPLAGTTKGSIKAIMHLLFERAMLWDMLEIQRNPIQLIRLRGVSLRKKKIVILSVDQFHKLCDVLPEPYRTMVVVGMCTGLRRSEIVALRGEHIQNGVLLVQASSIHGRVGPCKTFASAAEIPLHNDMLALIKPNNGLIFSNEDGTPISPGWVQKRYLRPAGRKLFGVENLGWHSLRHSYRSLLDGEPIGVQQKLMRHANVSTTMNVYGSSAMSAKREANGKVVQMVVGSVGFKVG
jgi:integrase